MNEDEYVGKSEMIKGRKEERVINKANRANDASSTVCGKLCAICFPRLLKWRDRPTDLQTDGRTDLWTDRPFYRDARTHLKNVNAGATGSNR